MLSKLFKNRKKTIKNNNKLEINFTEVFDKIEEIATAKFILHDDQYDELILIDDFGILMKNKLDSFSYFYESKELNLFGQINFCSKTTITGNYSLTEIFNGEFLSAKGIEKLHRIIDKSTYIKLVKLNNLFNSFYNLLQDELKDNHNLLNKNNNNYKKLSEQFCKLFYILCCTLANKEYRKFNYEFNDYSSNKIKIFDKLINEEMYTYCHL